MSGRESAARQGIGVRATESNLRESLLSVAAARSHVPDLDVLVLVLVVDAVADGLRNLFEATVES